MLKQNRDLWERLLINLLNKGFTPGASLVFNRGVKCLGNDSIHLWKIMKTYIPKNFKKQVCTYVYVYHTYVIFNVVKLKTLKKVKFNLNYFPFIFACRPGMFMRWVWS